MIGNNAHGPAKFSVGDDATSAIQTLIDESAHVLDFSKEITDDNKDRQTVGLAVGIDDVNGKPENLVLSFAIEEADEEGVIIGEQKRTTIVIPVAHAFTFGNGVVKVCDYLHDAILEQQIKDGTAELLSSLNGNQHKGD